MTCPAYGAHRAWSRVRGVTQNYRRAPVPEVCGVSVAGFRFRCMGVRGLEELVGVLPPAAAESARAVAAGLADLARLRQAALGPQQVRALGEVWERFTAQVGAARLGVLAAMTDRDDVIPK